MKLMQKIRDVFYRFPILISLALGIIGILITRLKGSLFTIFLIYPVILTLLNFFFLFGTKSSEEKLWAGKKIEILTLVLGSLLSVLFLQSELPNITFADWQETLVNSQLHSPIAPSTLPTIVVLSLAALIGYINLRFRSVDRLPPLVILLSISALYLGAILSGVWIVQLFDAANNAFLLLCLLPLNFIIITAKSVKELVIQWNEEHIDWREEKKYANRPFLLRCSRVLNQSYHWPWMALVLMLPLLGVFIAVLAPFGQAPDSIVKAWTETAQWNLSQRVAPQNVFYDEHYLCTVAAGGHKKVVKPLRLGRRHGHEVIVNRQLCVANAFEQILEEKTPRFHHVVRYLYDHCGYPIARHIHSPFAADMIYVLMKPAEWLFLAVIYLCDAKPENRIAVQYLPRPDRE